MERFFSEHGREYKPGIVTDLVLAAFDLERKGKRLISLSGGSYDPASFPAREVKDVIMQAPDAAWREILQYGSNKGYWRLRTSLTHWLSGKNIAVDPEKEILITTGSQQALDLIARIFVGKGDIIGIGSPTYMEALSIFKQSSPQFLVVPSGPSSLDLDVLEENLARLRKEGKSMKMLYTVPSFENPTGAIMPLENRDRLLQMAEEFDFIIVEDNPYGYIAFDDTPPEPIKTKDIQKRVVYLSTFSKIVSPGLRIGWIVADEAIVRQLALAKSATDLCSDGLSQYVAAEMLSRGLVDKQIDHITSIYREKRDLMLESMDIHFPDVASWTKPGGGIFLWVAMPEGFDATSLVFKSVDRGVAYIPGSNFFLDPSISNHIRLNYSYPSKPDIVEGIKILGGLLKENV